VLSESGWYKNARDNAKGMYAIRVGLVQTAANRGGVLFESDWYKNARNNAKVEGKLL
jgi:hypothetical protein